MAEINYFPLLASGGGGSSASTWGVARQASVLTIAPTLTEAHPLSTLAVLPDWNTAAATTTGLFQGYTSTNGGALQVKSGTTAGGVQIGRSVDPNQGRWSSNQKTQPWAIALRLQIATTPDAQTTMNFVSMYDGTVEIMLACHGATSTTNFTLRANGGAANNTDTGQAMVVAGGAYHNVAMVFDTTTLWLVYDDVKVNTGMTNLANFGTASAYIRSYATNGVTAANQEFHLSQVCVYTPPAT